ncbi:hypothetical protein [Deinococcus maricopensis]|uniref:4'-phosphopantetheinyl transferase N-terminal domain-containing protein n=1 Tax=Deinococcus maricopensis (strain DSM 21211 / LMG 22137 / NRRL B-23946 / LB-34) TaxID=709986 RepID=E8U3H3_DEIML|nr:hypothetical protein [Deinococcus maricopensis]ADV65844.1 hypothetical protein Deima_0180 [Deinococcus maricopensis DSM 21211]
MSAWGTPLDPWGWEAVRAGVRVVAASVPPGVVVAAQWDDVPDMVLVGAHWGVRGQRSGALVGVPAWLARAPGARVRAFRAGRRCAAVAVEALRGGRWVPVDGGRRGPRWPVGLGGSVSHSGGLTVALVGSGRLGVDVEVSGEVPGAFLTVGERALPRLGLGEVAWRRVLFSVREAAFKAGVAGAGETLLSVEVRKVGPGWAVVAGAGGVVRVRWALVGSGVWSWTF